MNTGPCSHVTGSSFQDPKEGPLSNGPHLFISPGSVNQNESMNYPEAHDFENQFSIYDSPPHASTLHAQDSMSSMDRLE